MRKWELIKQSQLLKIKSQSLSKLLNEKYGLRLGEFKNTTGTERVKKLKLLLFLPFQKLAYMVMRIKMEKRFSSLVVSGLNYMERAGPVERAKFPYRDSGHPYEICKKLAGDYM